MAVRDSAEGVRGDDADRERASDAVRSVSRSFLLSAALGGVVIPMIGVPLGAVAMIGAFQRMQALGALHATALGAKLVPSEWSRRTRLAAMTELGLGGLGVIFSFVGVPAVVMVAAEGLWLGAGGLSAVAGGMAMRAAWARAAATGEVVDPGRGIVPMMAGIGDHAGRGRVESGRRTAGRWRRRGLADDRRSTRVGSGGGHARLRGLGPRRGGVAAIQASEQRAG